MNKRNVLAILIATLASIHSTKVFALEAPADLRAILEKAQSEYGPLLALKQTESIVQGSYQKATSWPNPEVAFMWQDFLTSKSSQVSKGKFNLELQMPLELGGKRSAKDRAALAESELLTLEAEMQKAELLIEISNSFLDLKKTHALVQLAKQRENIAAKVAGIATQKLRAGKLSGVEEGRLTSLAKLAEIELADRELDAKKSEQRAALYVGNTSVSAKDFVFLFDYIPQVSKVSDGLPVGFSTRIAEAKFKKSHSEAAVASKEAFPNLTLKAATLFERSTGEKFYSIGFSLPMPLFDRNQGARLLASSLSNADVGRAKSTKLETARELSEMINSLEFSKKKALNLQKEILPRLRESTAMLSEAYAAGKVNYLALLETQESLFAVEEKYLETLLQLHKSIIRLVFSGQLNTGFSKVATLYSPEVMK